MAEVANTPLVLIILDGFGIAPVSKGNAIALARTPNLDKLIKVYPSTTLLASGEAVGLPWAEMGNSEVGHLNIGAGQVVYQSLPLINKSIGDGTFFENAGFTRAIEHTKEHGSSLHIMGLLSNSGIHGQLDHLLALLEFCQKNDVKQVYLHPFLDGRDSPKDSAVEFVQRLQAKMNATGVGKIASLSGRFYAMDRDNRWERIEKAYLAISNGQSERKATDPLQAIETSYQGKVFDEEFLPTVITSEDGSPIAKVQDNDAVIFYNFRPDRARQITKAFTLTEFNQFERPRKIENLFFVAMTEYEKGLPVSVAYPPQINDQPLGKIISDIGLKQVHIAETEKYAHVTFFFNGGIETKFPGEERLLVPSPKVKSYDETPEMSAREITKKVLQELERGEYEFFVVNYANADMVGHTGNLNATKQAVEVIDEEVGKVIDALLLKKGVAVITADHGNAEVKLDLQTGVISKGHTTNPVLFIMVGPGWEAFNNWFPEKSKPYQGNPQSFGILADIAPTILHILGVAKPKLMSGRSLIPK